MTANKIRHALTLSIATTLLLVAAPATAQDAISITIKNFNFMPMALTVPVGGSVTWKNADGEPHTVTSVDGLFRSGALDQNDSFTFKFTKAGTFKYMCSIHPRMVASIVVK
jgi:plastocyanin